MPYIKIQTNKEINDKEIVTELSKRIASVLGKPEDYVMAAVDDGVTMSMSGSLDPAVFVELKSIGLPDTETGRISEVICNFIEEKMNIAGDRVYIVFSDVNRKMWGWNGRTF